MTSPGQPVSSTAGYLAFPVTTDADQLATDALSYLTANLPGFVPREGHLEVWLVRAFARMVAEAAQVAAQVPLGVYQYFGQQLVGVAPLAGSPAQMQSTWTLTDTAGHTIPKGTTVGYRSGPGGLVLFRTTADVTVAAGSSATAAGAVGLSAVNVGAANNGLPAASLTLVDNLSFVASVQSTTTTSGGADAETQGAYLNRLTSDLRLLAPRPILPADFAALARNQAAVDRATAIDGYDPANPTVYAARTVGVAAVDANGNALSTAQQTAVSDALKAQREANFVVNIVAPTYTAVSISAQVTTVHGATQAAVSQACTDALNRFLSPAHWGDTQVNGVWQKGWTNTTTVRQLTIGALLAAVPGVAFVSGVQIGIGTGALASTDGTLPGAVPLPAATGGTLNIAVTAG